MAKTMAPAWGQHTVISAGLGSFDEIRGQESIGGILECNHRSYAYDGQTSGYCFIPDNGLILGSQYREISQVSENFSAGSHQHANTRSIFFAERPHQGVHRLTLMTYGRDYDCQLIAVDLDNLSQSIASDSYNSGVPAWRELTLDLYAEVFEVRVEYRRAIVGGVNGRVWISSLRETILEESDL